MHLPLENEFLLDYIQVLPQSKQRSSAFNGTPGESSNISKYFANVRQFFLLAFRRFLLGGNDKGEAYGGVIKSVVGMFVYPDEVSDTFLC